MSHDNFEYSCAVHLKGHFLLLPRLSFGFIESTLYNWWTCKSQQRDKERCEAGNDITYAKCVSYIR